ncbi:MAG: type II toxin-antitoxin system HicA family toxin [Micrococcales bacterium]|nr:type II toxin-antitoxin system HicA family toxin [Micrococcales bacterium]
MRARRVNTKIERSGGVLARQRGSHQLYRVVAADGTTAQTIVPQHTGDIPVGTLRAIERDLAPVLGERWLR